MKVKSTYSKKVDVDLLEISGSLEEYEKDMERFAHNLKREILRLRSSKAGRAQLKRAGLNP